MTKNPKLIYKEAVIITGEMWRSVTKEEKSGYVKLFEQDWKNYIKMKSEWDKNYANLENFNNYDDYNGPLKPPKRP